MPTNRIGIMIPIRNTCRSGQTQTLTYMLLCMYFLYGSIYARPSKKLPARSAYLNHTRAPKPKTDTSRLANSRNHTRHLSHTRKPIKKSLTAANAADAVANQLAYTKHKTQD
jgi:hypothetical protein